MMKENLSKKIQEAQRRMKGLNLALDRINREYQQVLDNLGVTHEELKNSTENFEDCSPEEREILENEKRKLDERLNLGLSQIRDVSHTENVFAERKSIQPHWLFVR
jgi:predicted  nucleic acid-binding Zn-ribbon protein